MSDDERRTAIAPGAIRSSAIIAGNLALYIAVAIAVGAATGDPVAGAAASGAAVLIAVLIWRRGDLGRSLITEPSPEIREPVFWAFAVMGLGICWLLGQGVAEMIYRWQGSEGFDAVTASRQGTPLPLLLITALVIAPAGEEALMRGLVYPVMKSHWPVLAAAFVSSAVFALLHGNLVQIALTLPLGILLALVYEASQRLWPVIIMHMAFNGLSIVPRSAIESMAASKHSIAFAGVLLAALVLCVAAIYPRAD